MGVAKRADASEAQRDEGLTFLRTELARLARLHPQGGRAPADLGERRSDRRIA
jgi:hypothetical protein